MQARFFAVVMLVYFSITLLPLAALAVLDPHPGGRTTLVLFVGAQVVALSLLARVLLLAELPQQDRALREKWRRWRARGSAAGIVPGAVLIVVGLFLIASPVPASLGSAVAMIALVALVHALDRYADRIATEHPIDRLRADDEDRLAPGAIRATLRRRAVQGLVAGAVAGTVVAIALAVLVPGDAWAVWAGLALMVIVDVAPARWKTRTGLSPGNGRLQPNRCTSCSC